jgi:crossover junction endodeoxyribonuclease RuvC
LVILGIDPGLTTSGFGIIEVSGRIVQCLDFGCVRSQKLPNLAEKLNMIYNELNGIIEKHEPGYCAIESIFYHENVNTAIIMGHARGVAMLAAERANIEVFEYTPREIKMSVTGSGAASKEQIQAMVQNLLKLKTPPRPFDASDALAVAICHHHRMNTHKLEILV